MHLERENAWNKDEDTIEKLFSQTDKEYIPHNVIGIPSIESAERIHYLNELVLQKNTVQQSNYLMIYRYYDDELKLERVCAYSFNSNGVKEVRSAICKEMILGIGICTLMKSMFLFKMMK